ncbi:MAG: hypothetical protein DRN15_02370 [Thermoprotei archaeon]|nr:MAG: hypothetical protein DRN15_02370 [Thermoprotei archaeon]RLF25645.1 MAG: hypothetical protein DRM97_01130 [Thermoprotei archaeon]
MLSLINRLSWRLQSRHIGGIPRFASKVYDKLATRLITGMYSFIAQEIIDSQLKPNILVDVGCSSVRLFKTLHEMVYSPMFMVGIDISKFMTNIALRNMKRNDLQSFVDIVQADAHNLPIRESSVDLLLSSGTLHHLSDSQTFFKECIRVLKDRGEAWIFELSHDVPKDEEEIGKRMFRRPKVLLKLASALHGIPRLECERGGLRSALEKSRCHYEISYHGFLTKLILRRSYE